MPLLGTNRRWTNIWEGLDLMAFLAEPVFELANGGRPHDVEMRLDTSTLSTHSAYWDSPILLAELDRAWRDSPAGHD